MDNKFSTPKSEKIKNNLSLRSKFSLKYDVTDAMLQDIEKIKVQYLMSLSFDLFEILQAVRSEQMNLA